MSFFKRSPKEPSPALGVSVADLERLGRATFGGPSPHPPGFAAERAELDQYAIKGLEAAGYPASDGPEWQAMMDRVLGELVAVAGEGGPFAWVGALAIAQNFVTAAEQQHPGYLELVDRGLLALRDDGVAFPALPQSLLRRWEEVHGVNGLGPGNWPSALETTEIPRRDVPLPPELTLGSALCVSVRDASPQSNAIFVEHRADGTFQVLTEALDPEDGARKRWEWDGLSAPDYGTILHELGDRLVTPTYWAHDDLAEFFPCRSRSRDELRIEARTLAG